MYQRDKQRKSQLASWCQTGGNETYEENCESSQWKQRHYWEQWFKLQMTSCQKKWGPHNKTSSLYYWGWGNPDNPYFYTQWIMSFKTENEIKTCAERQKSKKSHL